MSRRSTSSFQAGTTACRIKEVTSAVSLSLLLESCRNSITPVSFRCHCRSAPNQPVFITPPCLARKLCYTLILISSSSRPPGQPHIIQTWLPGTISPKKELHHASNCNPNNCLLIFIKCLHNFREEYQRLLRRRRRVNLYLSTSNRQKSSSWVLLSLVYVIRPLLPHSVPDLLLT
jgi:hypothetical protein